MNNKYNVLLLGSGGREHALAWKLSVSPLLNHLWIAPGNAGTATYGTNVAMSETDFDSIREFCLGNQVEMLVVGPEAPLVAGIHDFFLSDPQLRVIPVIGPRKAGAELEGSKDFAKEFMTRNFIPTATYKTFTREMFQEALDFLGSMEPPYVLKADGLAAGKGVIICATKKEAEDEIVEILVNSRFGAAGNKLVIEQFLTGIEMSAFVLTDGSSYLILPEAKDYKRIGDGDTGPNTGGMGAVSPVAFADKTFLDKLEVRVIMRTIKGLAMEGIPYKGFLFFGIMNVSGEPYLIEYNCRLGDPETEAILPRIKTDILELFVAVAGNSLKSSTLEISTSCSACIMLVSGGYPGEYDKGIHISIPDDLAESTVFHAGTRLDAASGKLLTNGGRVLAVSSLGTTLDQALQRSYKSAELITFDKMYYRHDIGNDLLHFNSDKT